MIKSLGDGWLIEFKSASKPSIAFRMAKAIQETRKIRFRVGIILVMLSMRKVRHRMFMEVGLT